MPDGVFESFMLLKKIKQSDFERQFKLVISVDVLELSC